MPSGSQSLYLNQSLRQSHFLNFNSVRERNELIQTYARIAGAVRSRRRAHVVPAGTGRTPARRLGIQEIGLPLASVEAARRRRLHLLDEVLQVREILPQVLSLPRRGGQDAVVGELGDTSALGGR